MRAIRAQREYVGRFTVYVQVGNLYWSALPSLSPRLWLRHRVLHKHPPALRIFFVTGTFDISSLRPNSHSPQVNSLPTSHTIPQAQGNTYQLTNSYPHRHNDKGNDQEWSEEEDAGGIEGGEKRLQLRELRFVCSSPRT